ncbi:MAG: HPF/RaiA family ribosome-associated protein [Bacteroidetes bacterium]|nr:HPF/RaiA family ribosome-associated protein [Bacteroidota bacterium]
MKLIVQSAHSHVSPVMLTYAQETLQKLAGKYDEILTGKLDFKEEEDDQAKKKTVTIMLNMPGHRIYTHTRDTNYERAFAEAVDKLEHQLRKTKWTHFPRPTGYAE